MSWNMAMPLLEFLEEKGYLQRIVPPRTHHGKIKDKKTKYMYQTTQKGRKALMLINGQVLKGLFDYKAWLREQKEIES